MTNKHIKQSSWEENIESYPDDVTPGKALLITFGSLLLAWVVVEVIVGADDVMYWIAGVIAN